MPRARNKRILLFEAMEKPFECDPTDNSLWFDGKKIVTYEKVQFTRIERVFAGVVALSVLIQAVISVVCYTQHF